MEEPFLPTGAIVLWTGDDIPSGFEEAHIQQDGYFLGGKIDRNQSLPSNPVAQSFQTQHSQHVSVKTIIKLDEDPAAKEKRLRERNASMLNLKPNGQDKY